MFGRYFLQGRAKNAARHEQWNSIALVRRWWPSWKGKYATLRPGTIKENYHAKLMRTMQEEATNNQIPISGIYWRTSSQIIRSLSMTSFRKLFNPSLAVLENCLTSLLLPSKYEDVLSSLHVIKSVCQWIYKRNMNFINNMNFNNSKCLLNFHPPCTRLLIRFYIVF